VTFSDISPLEKRELLFLSRSALETYLREGKIIDTPNSFSLPRRQQGVFVTIRNGKEVRGCQGTLIPAKENLNAEIIENTIRAATSDRRYPSVSLHELNRIKIQIAIVKDWVEIEGKDKLRDPKRFGLVIENGERTGVILPGEVKTSSWQYRKACKMAGVKSGDRFRMFVFEAIVIKE
jgi:uncharacterized protein (TIGR00296 family)